MPGVMQALLWVIVGIAVLVIIWKIFSDAKRDRKNFERSLKMVPMLIHLPPSTDDIQAGGRDERDVIDEQISEAQVMYSIIASTLTKGLKSKLYGQRHISFEIVANKGYIKYYAIVPAVLTETIRQAITAAYPSVRLEEVEDPNFFSAIGGIDAVAGGELRFKDDYWYPLATYEDTKRDASLGLINALSTAKDEDGIGIQIMFRPTDGGWVRKSLERVQNIKDGKKERHMANNILGRFVYNAGNFFVDLLHALWQPPEEHEKWKDEEKILTNLQQEEITKIEDKTKYPGFETLIRIVASSDAKPRSEMLLNNIVSIFSQFDLQGYNGFRYDMLTRSEDLVRDYVLRTFPQTNRSMIMNSVELASLFHLPSQNAIPTSQVERQLTKQVDGPAKLPEEGVILGVNKFRGEEKIIRLGTKDRRRHTYVIGSTGMGKSILLTNIAYQDMCDGRGFAFIDPHGDAVDLLLSKVPPERMDDVILFEPGNLERPVGMNMFEFTSEDQKDFIVQEGLNMLVSLYDPGNQGIFGPRAQHMFRNAALLLMSDPAGGTFIDIPRCFIDPEFVKKKLRYVTDKTVYDYWTKEFPASQKSNDAGEVTSWFVSKWGPFLSNKMMRNILGQTKSGFNIREIMDNKKILLVNLSKGRTGEMNAKLLGMIFVMKFQAAAMSRADMPEDEREDFCLFVDEFQNFATESFESILSEARKYRLNLVLANQFMTQLTDKIREAILGNVGTIMSGRLGVTDAELMEKAFSPIFTAEDLHKQANFTAIATVMMFDMPSSPFTMSLLPPMGESSDELMVRMREYVLSKYGRPRAEVDREVEERLASGDEDEEEAVVAKPAATGAAKPAVAAGAVAAPVAAAQPVRKPKKSFLDAWLEKKAKLDAEAKQEAIEAAEQKIVKEDIAARADAAKPATAVAPEPPKITNVHGDHRKIDTNVPAAKMIIPDKPVPPKTDPRKKVIKPIAQQDVSAAAKAATEAPIAAAAAMPAQKAIDKIVAQTPQAPEKVEAAESLVERYDGATWVAQATQNAVEDTSSIRIRHDYSRRTLNLRPSTPAPQAQPAAQAAPQPVAQPANPQMISIPHNTAIRTPVAPRPAAQAAPQPVAAQPAQPVANGQMSVQPQTPVQSQPQAQVQQDASQEGVVLRWR